MESAPVALFVYSRPEHTQRTLEALSRNALAEQTTLYIFSDGVPEDANRTLADGIRDVRRIIREQQWCGDVVVKESTGNRGLARSIIDGVSEVSERHGRVIVLEDDLETSPGFLTYMNHALDLYGDSDRVMQVSGFNVPNPWWSPATGFLRVSTSWGWGTWHSAWQHYNDDADFLLKQVEDRGRASFDLEGHSFHFEELQKNMTGELRTWAVRWYASIFLRDGLCLYPRQSLVRNLGFDGTGENCFNDSTGFHRSLRVLKNVSVKRLELSENSAYLKSMQKRYRDQLRQWTRTRLRDRVVGKLKRLLRTSDSAR